jgi:hypothetical protein
MAKIKLEDLVGELERGFTEVLKETIKEVYPKERVDEQKLFRTFKYQITRRFRNWEQIRDSYIEK